MTDIEIAQSAEMLPITEILKKLGFTDEEYELYGKYKAKLNLNVFEKLKHKKDGKLILVTAITPTSFGEGKTTTTIGLADGLNLTGKKAVVALREPSLGPVFGVKGGAAGGGYAQVVPMEDINLHFTGDFHAIGAANNLLCAMIDNHIQQGNELKIDPKRITFKRVVDMNDRQLRNIVDGLGGRANGVPREDGFDITVASEVMAILCLAEGIDDLKNRLSKIVIGYTYDGAPVYCKDLKAQGAMTALLKDAVKPNVVQTLEHTPAFVHGGPFANIAHGCNSVLATKLALKCGDYCVTEAGFGADLGAEKFLDIKCRTANLKPDCVVVVATVRALKMHGGVTKADLPRENVEALRKGFANLNKHVRNMTDVYGLKAVVAINKFPSDTTEEIKTLKNLCEENGFAVSVAEGFEKGGAGMTDLAEKVIELSKKPSVLTFPYSPTDSLKDKILSLTEKIYGGAGVTYTATAEKQIAEITELGFSSLPVCMAKTQYSLSDNPALFGAPSGFTLTVRNVKVSNGAGFVVILTGDVMTMPGLPKKPAAKNIDVKSDGKIVGLF